MPPRTRPIRFEGHSSSWITFCPNSPLLPNSSSQRLFTRVMNALLFAKEPPKVSTNIRSKSKPYKSSPYLYHSPACKVAHFIKPGNLTSIFPDPASEPGLQYVYKAHALWYFHLLPYINDSDCYIILIKIVPDLHWKLR
jgi:hypothetical protein